MTNKPLQMTTEDKLVRVYIFASHMENIFKIQFFFRHVRLHVFQSSLKRLLNVNKLFYLFCCVIYMYHDVIIDLFFLSPYFMTIRELCRK